MNPTKFAIINIVSLGALSLIIYLILSEFVVHGALLYITTGIIALGLQYFMTFFILSRLLIPNLGFKKSRIPKRIPKRMFLAIKKLKNKSRNKNEYLKNVYKYLTKRYYGKKRTVLKKPSLLFEVNLKKMWKKRGFIPCHSFCHMFRVFLVKSKLFRDREIKINHTFFNFNIHQYMEVKVRKKWKKIDPWGHKIGIKFGDYARMFK